MVLLPELGDGKYATTVAQKILSAIARPFVLPAEAFTQLLLEQALEITYNDTRSIKR